MEKPCAYESITEDERTRAHAIVYAGRKFGSSRLRKLNNKGLTAEEMKEVFLEVYNQASHAVAGMDFMELSPAIRSYIALRHGLSSDFRFRNTDTVGPSLLLEIENEMRREKEEAVLQDFGQALLRDPKHWEHRLHPEDERDILDDLPRFIANENAFGPYPPRHPLKKHL